MEYIPSQTCNRTPIVDSTMAVHASTSPEIQGTLQDFLYPRLTSLSCHTERKQDITTPDYTVSQKSNQISPIQFTPIITPIAATAGINFYTFDYDLQV